MTSLDGIFSLETSLVEDPLDVGWHRHQGGGSSHTLMGPYAGARLQDPESPMVVGVSATTRFPIGDVIFSSFTFIFRCTSVIG